MDDFNFTYAQYKPGVARMAALVDFGCFRKPEPDPKRIEYIKKRVSTYMADPNPVLNKLWVGLRPFTPDNLEIIGPMKHYPNVVLNMGYGPQGF